MHSINDAMLFFQFRPSECLSVMFVVPVLYLNESVMSSMFRRDASICIARISYGNVSGWLAVCHSRYCIKTTKPILKLFRPSGSPIIEAYGTTCADTKFQGEPLQRGLYIHGVGKIGDFRRKWPIFRKRCEIGR